MVSYMSANFYGKYVNHGVMVYHLFITNLRGDIKIVPRIGAILIGQNDVKIAAYWKVGVS